MVLEAEKQQLSEAKQLLQQQKQEIAQQKSDVSQTELKLRQEKAKIPQASARLLRQGMFAGLEGRKRRIAIETAKKFLESKEEEVKAYKKGLEEFEKQEIPKKEADIQRYETELAEYERQYAEYERHLEALNLAKKVYHGNKTVLILMDNKLARDYYRQLKASEDVSISKPFAPQTILKIPSPLYKGAVFESGMSTPTGYQVTYRLPSGGAEIATYSPSGKLISGMSVAGTIKIKLPKPPRFEFKELAPPKDLPKTDLLKDYKRLQTTNVLDITKKAAEVLSRQFFTAGSPVKFTPLTKPISRGYESIQAGKSPLTPKPTERKIKPSLFGKLNKKKSLSIAILKKSRRGIFGADNIFSKINKINLWTR